MESQSESKFDLTQDVINLKGKSSTHRKTAEWFLEDIIFLSQNGYVLHPTPHRRFSPNFRGGYPVACMVKKEALAGILKAAPVVVATPEPVVEAPAVTPEVAVEAVVEATPDAVVEDSPLKAEIEALSAKQDMLDWAKKNNIVVPKDKKAPMAIKAFLLKNI